MRKSTIRAVAVLAAFGLVAAACGDDDDDSGDESETTEAEADDEGDTPDDDGDDMAEDEGDDMADGFDLGGRTVTVAVENAYLPFNYLDPETGEPTGWDYETIDEICNRLNCVPDYQTFSWEPMIQAVADGQFDMAADGITITEERAQIVDFSDGYIAIEQRLLVGLDSPFTSIQDVIDDGCSVASQVGTTNLQTAIDTFGEDRVVALEEFGFVVQSVIAGDNCAAVIDETAGQGYVGANADEVQLIGDSLSSDQLGFIFTPGSELTAAFNHALDGMKADGTLEEISSRYFGDSFTITYDDIEFPDAPGDDDAAGELIIGTILPETGALAFLAPPQLQAVELAREDLAAAGAPVTILTGDSGTDPDVAQETANRLLGEGANAILGAAASGVSQSIIQNLFDNQIPQCSASNTSPAFTGQENAAFYFRAVPPDEAVSPIIADVMAGDGLTNVAIAARADDYGNALANLVASELTALGVANTVVTFDPENAAADAVVSDIAAVGADGVLLIAFGEGIPIIQAALEAGVPASAMYVPDGLFDPALNAAVDESNPNVLDGLTMIGASGGKDFNDRLSPLTDGNLIYGGQGYDCMMMLSLAFAQAGTTDGQALYEAAIAVSRDDGGDTACSTYEECVAALDAGEGINYEGVAGPLDLDDGGDPTFGRYAIAQFQDGALVTIDSQDIDLNF
ncbi:MAG: transporter substrate-binding domain-containing protein [Ilumatobacter sp.]|uniref:transporter substrate-binding domain-containing protein n=1 Tax=Ilumatobacter sp. TaxID=1967498 RepID=UPI00260EAF50|nr:transporter substrate-binding domain-containing protein [Ilumatobacter sp.]MDJ0768869.1 transporter substrate-binding domain-containing protein [Ilumatobacter sp.]